MREWLKEPLLHFVALGLGLFVLYGVVGADRADSGAEIVVDRGRIEALIDQHERLWQRPPSEAELDALIEGWIREQILYREGLAAGLDRNDAIVRRRVVQKMTFVAEGLASDLPSDEDVETWFREHADDYRRDAVYALSQVYFDPDRHTEDLDRVVAHAREALEKDADAKVGDPTLLPPQLGPVPARDIQRVFGATFVEGLEALPVGGWSGPIRSSYGLHLVRLDERQPARVPALSEVRARVERDLVHERTQENIERFYRSARERYRVRIEPWEEPRKRVAAGDAPMGPGS